MAARNCIWGVTLCLLFSACNEQEKTAAKRPGGGIYAKIEEITPDSFLIREEVYLDSLLATQLDVRFLNDSTVNYDLSMANKLRFAAVTKEVLAVRAGFQGLFGFAATECLEELAVNRYAYIDEVAFRQSLEVTMPRLRETAYLSDKSRTGFGVNCREIEGTRSSRSYGG